MKHTARAIAIGFILVGILSSGCAGGSAGEPRVVEAEHTSMGAPVHITAWTADQARARAAVGAAFSEFDRLDALLSVWKEGSDVLRLNAAAGERPVTVSRETREVLRAAAQVGDWTGGKFDVTFGALSGLWKFDHDQDNVVPDMAEVRRRLPLIDYRAVRVDDAAGTAFITRGDVRVHLGGVGKGYAVDRAAAILRGAGIRDFMIQSGGDLYVAGRRGDRAWRVGVRDPRGPADRSFAAIDLTDATFSTSGDYERFFLRNGRRYHHILDPDTGEPASLSRSVTVVAKEAVLADALSTGIFVMGPDAGMALVERLPDVEAVIVGADNRVRVSSGLSGRLTLLAAPTDAP